MYDVIVAGAGPGGASAAYFLGQAGLKVLVLEKEEIPRYKACGGGVSIRTLEKYFPFSFAPVIECQAHSLSYHLGRHSVQIPLLKPSLVTVMRERFDAHILSHARAEVLTRSAIRSIAQAPDQVVVETQAGRIFTGRYLIGADGVNSIVARSVDLRRGKVTAAAVEAEVPVPATIAGRYRDNPAFIFGEVRQGYAWIFPKADHLSMGVVSLRPRPGEIRAVLDRIAGRCQIPLDGVKLQGHSIPLHLRREQVAAGRVLLVGDAAGLADPLSGEGIRMAIKSASLASKAILQGRPDLYPDWVETAIGRDLRRILPLARLFYQLPLLCHLLGERNPFVSEAFMDLLSDEANYVQLFLCSFGTLPVFLLTEAGAALYRLSGRSNKAEQLRDGVYWSR